MDQMHAETEDCEVESGETSKFNVVVQLKISTTYYIFMGKL